MTIEKDQKRQEWIVEWWPQEGPLSNPCREVDNPPKIQRKLLRCSGCKQALYCSQNCQKMDWNVSFFSFFFLKDHYVAMYCNNNEEKFDCGSIFFLWVPCFQTNEKLPLIYSIMI